MVPWYRRLGMIAAVSGLVGTAMCAGEFDTRRVPPEHVGTIGEETFRVVCERVDVGESPDDIDFARARPYCTGAAAPSDGGTMNDGVGPKVRAMAARRTAIAAAIDRTIPESLGPEADALLVQLLPLYGPDGSRPRDAGVRLADGGRAPAEDLLPQSTRALSRLLEGIADDNDAVAALARISRHQGYRPPRVALGLTRSLLSYPQVGTVLERTLGLFREPTDLRPGGAGYAQFQSALDVLRGELASAAPAPPQEQQRGTTLDATLDLLFRSDAALSTGRERLLVRRDHRGMPRVVRGLSGEMPAPFVDMDGDGLADAANGRFVNRRTELTVPSPFPANEAPDGPRDAAGRAVVMGTQSPLYEYVDLDRTVLAALLRDSRALVDPAHNTALRFAHGAAPLLGARVPATRDYMVTGACPAAGAPDARCRAAPASYNGFDASRDAPLVDTVHAAGTLLASRDVDAILQTFEALFGQHEGVLARNTAALLALDESADRNPGATIDPRSNLWDDVIDIARQIVQIPGLLEDVLAALADPRTQNLGRAFAAFARNRDRIEPTWSMATFNNSLASRTLSTAVDRSRPDTVEALADTRVGGIRVGPNDNRSVFQRFLHLIHDLNGVELCNREGAQVRSRTPLGTVTYPTTYRRCALIRIPDAAVFYLKVIAGTGRIEMMDTGLLGWVSRLSIATPTLDGLIQSQSLIQGFDTTPTPEAVNRLVFQPDSLRTEFTNGLLDPVTTRDGLDVRTVHPGTLFALELYDFYNSFRPLAQAFDRHGDRATNLLIRLLSAVHLHYPSDRAGQFQRADARNATTVLNPVPPSARLYNTMDGAVRYEPILVDAFGGDLMAASGELMRVLPMVNAGGGRNGRDAVAALARVLLDPNAVSNIAYRDGRTHTFASDGTTRIDRPSVYHLFADAFNGIDARLGAAPAERASWEAARSRVVDQFLAVDGAGSNAARFRNRQIPAVSRLAVRWARDRVAAHRAVGDVDPWARGLGARLGAVVSGAAFATSFDLLMAVYDDAPTRAAVGGLLVYLLDDSARGADNSFGTTLTALADLVQILRADADIDPLLHALAPAFQRGVRAPDGGVLRAEAVPVSLRFLDRARDYDEARVLDRILANVVSRPANPLLADEPIVVLGDAIAETHRLEPGRGGPLSADDFREVLRQVAQFFTDESRGMEQFYFIVQNRRIQ